MANYRAHPLPDPVPTPITAPFWAGTRERKLLLQRCSDCGAAVYYARSHCPNCLSRNLDWFEGSGRGRVYSYTVVRRPQSPDFVDDIPYVVAAITLDEGPRMTSLLVEVEPENVKVESPVEVVWQETEGGYAMPYFRPAGRK